MDWLWRCRLASTVASTPSSMAQDDRALEGEGVGGVSNGQALWPVRGDLGGRDSWQCEYATFCSGSALGD